MWLGLILPIISFSISIISVFNVYIPDHMSGGQVFISLLGTFLITNIPTAILIAIYFACRENMKKEYELERMNIQDL